MSRSAILLGLSIVLVAAGQASAQDLAVIVNVDREARLTISEIARIYLKQRRFWNDRDPIVPLNRDAGSPARESFVRAVFGAKARQLADYWNQQYFRGVLPPATLASDEAVRRFVASEPRAIGYIVRSAVDDSIRVVLYLQDTNSVSAGAAEVEPPVD